MAFGADLFGLELVGYRITTWRWDGYVHFLVWAIPAMVWFEIIFSIGGFTNYGLKSSIDGCWHLGDESKALDLSGCVQVARIE